MKLSDYKGTDAVELLADLLEPIGEIFDDEEAVKLLRGQAGNSTKERMKLIGLLLKRHKKTVIQILAIIDGEDVSTYSPSFYELPKKLIELFSDEEFMSLFTSQGQSANDLSSGPVTAITQVDGEA